MSDAAMKQWRKDVRFAERRVITIARMWFNTMETSQTDDLEDAVLALEDVHEAKP